MPFFFAGACAGQLSGITDKWLWLVDAFQEAYITALIVFFGEGLFVPHLHFIYTAIYRTTHSECTVNVQKDFFLCFNYARGTCYPSNIRVAQICKRFLWIYSNRVIPLYYIRVNTKTNFIKNRAYLGVPQTRWKVRPKYKGNGHDLGENLFWS